MSDPKVQQAVERLREDASIWAHHPDDGYKLRAADLRTVLEALAEPSE